MKRPQWLKWPWVSRKRYKACDRLVAELRKKDVIAEVFWNPRWGCRTLRVHIPAFTLQGNLHPCDGGEASDELNYQMTEAFQKIEQRIAEALTP